MKNKYCVYVHTNKINGKRYVGVTGQNPKKRWGGGAGYATNSHFYSAIKKYGWNGFSHEIIADRLSLDDAYALERKLISEYNSTNRKCGYNIDLGGSGSGTKTSESRERNRAKMNRLYRETDLREKISLGGQRRFSRVEEHKKLSDAAICRNQDPVKFANICEGNRRRWEKEEEHKKMSESLKKYYAQNPQRLKEMSEERKHYFAEHPEKKKTRAVVQLSKAGEVIKVWSNMTEAAKQFGTNSQNISAVCNGRRRIAGGYLWRYAM